MSRSSAEPPAAAAPHWPGLPVACRERFGACPRSRVPGPQSVHPYTPREAVGWLALAGNASSRTRFHCTGCRYPDKDIGILSIRFSLSCGTRVLPPRSFRNVGASIGSGESMSIAKLHSNRHRIVYDWEVHAGDYITPSTRSRHEPLFFYLNRLSSIPRIRMQ